MTSDLDSIRHRHTRKGDTCSLCGLGWPCDTIRVLEHGDANPPTQWAYDQACKALEKHRARAERLERQRDAVLALCDQADSSGEWDIVSTEAIRDTYSNNPMLETDTGSTSRVAQ